VEALERELPIEVPRDHNGSFEPQLIPKHWTRWKPAHAGFHMCAAACIAG